MFLSVVWRVISKNKTVRYQKEFFLDVYKAFIVNFSGTFLTFIWVCVGYLHHIAFKW